MDRSKLIKQKSEKSGFCHWEYFLVFTVLFGMLLSCGNDDAVEIDVIDPNPNDTTEVTDTTDTTDVNDTIVSTIDADLVLSYTVEFEISSSV